MRRVRLQTAITVCVLFVFLSTTVWSQAGQTTSEGSQASAGAKAQSKSSGGNMPSASEIAAAKASGKVWVNLDTGKYHKGGRWYGKTKNGKFMTESAAKAAGYKASKR